MVSIRNGKNGEGEIDRSQSSINSYWKISDDHFLVLNTGNDSEISDPVFPEFTQLGALKGLTKAAGVF